MSSEKERTRSSSQNSEEIQAPDLTWHKLDEVGYKFSEDKLEGAASIASWYWGKPLVRKLYHLAEKTNSLPFFPSGSKLAIRKSVVRAHVWAKERKAFSTEKEEQLVQLAILLSKLLALVRQSNPSRPSVDPTAIHLWTGLLYEISRAIDKILNEP